MKFLITLLFLVLLAGVVFAAIIYTIARAALYTGSSSAKAINQTLSQLRALIAPQRSALAPWDEEMLPLLSLNREGEKKHGWGSPVATGSLISIYHEPVVHYAIRRIGKSQALIVAQTSNREYVFRVKEKETEIWVNSEPLGVFAAGSLLSAERGSSLLAQLDLQTGEKFFPLQLDNEIAATIANPERAEGPNPRALTLLRKTLTREQEDVLMTLTLLQHLRP